MLTHLTIRNFAIIESSAIEFASGMTALTGETGAGKSILLDALGLVLGNRASADSVQQGAARADIVATFALESLPEVASWLGEHELDADDECIIRRTINGNGKSRATVNDVPVSVQLLRELGSRLVNIHGQHAHQTLTKSSEQLLLLDHYAGTDLPAKVQKAYDQWRKADKACREYEQARLGREQQLDLLTFQLNEFDELAIGQSSVEDIESEHRWLANADRIASLGQSVLAALDDEAYPALTRGLTPLNDLVGLDERLRESLDLVESAHIQISEAAQTVRQSMSQLEHDGSRLEWLEQKLAVLHRLARKHQCEISTLASVESNLRDQLDELQAPQQSAEELEANLKACREHYDDLSVKLSKHRSKHASHLERKITETMQTLNMTGGVFKVEVSSSTDEPRATGADSVVFKVSSNPGVSPAPLAKIASGGELSRISLALQLATRHTQSVPTLIFDEVDSGVGGAVAETVGQLLREVGQNAQVLCVTHLPQVAAQAHNHLTVRKSVHKGKTRTQVEPLDDEAIRDEIARMLGGATITEKSRQHAQEMLDAAT